MESPLVSVIIPIYNVEKYISECIESILRQTYKNIEIIAINDGSTDNSLDIVKKYAVDNPHIKVLSQQNSGLSITRNKGINYSNGKYIYFLDSDDYILPDTLKNLIGLMEKNDLDLIQFGGKPFIDNIDMQLNSNFYDVQAFFQKNKIYKKTDFLQDVIKGFRSQPCLYIVKKELIVNNNLQFMPNVLHEDELFTLEIVLNTKSAMYDPNLYYQRRYRENSIMTSNSIEKIKKSFDSYCIIIEEMNSLKKTYTNKLQMNLINSRMRSIYISLINKEFDESYKKSKLSKIKVINRRERLFYHFKYKTKKHVKNILRYSSQ
ncbi:glycosyltransferase [Priestia megaterium]